MESITGYAVFDGLLYLCGLVLLLLIYSWHKQNYFSRYGIQKKPTHLVLGDLPLVMKEGLGYITVEDINKHGKVFGTFLGNIPSVNIVDVDIIKQMMTKQFPNFMNRAVVPFPLMRGGDRILPNAADDNWKFVRHNLSPAFSLGKLKPMVSQIQHCLVTLDKHLDTKIQTSPGGFNIIPLLKNFTLDVILHVGFGIETDAQSDPDNGFVKNARGLLDVNPVYPFLLLFFIIPELKVISKFIDLTTFPPKCMEFFDVALADIIKDRKRLKQTGCKDLLQLMIDAQNKQISEAASSSSDSLSDADVIGNAEICMTAGYDTVSSVLTWFLYDMVVHPECQQKLIHEIDTQLGQEEGTYENVFCLQYLDMALSETMRIHPPGANIMRAASEEVELCGVRIPAGIEVKIPLTALHFMPEYWDDPLQYMPERFSAENKDRLETYAYMPFGLGPRNCIASRLALMELKLAIVHIFKRFTFTRAPGLQVPLPVKRLIVISPDAPVPVVAKRRKINQ